MGDVPKWILKYKEKIERGEITAEEILEEENKIREKPLKLATVLRAINALGYSVADLRAEKKKAKPKKKEEAKEEKGIEVKKEELAVIEVSKDTEKRFIEIKESWEKALGKPMTSDRFLNILLVLARLAEQGKTLVKKS
ncbi:MAG TPA: hypothetical protein ENF26_05925 [Methanomicrobia archaeon]|nr:hypothetical protein [Methanomicrobia archaeon]HEX59666.1 hypothetical protein [Methanomicrobia archaeon]